MHATAKELIDQSPGETTRMQRWLNDWLAKHQLLLRYPPAGMDYAMTAVITRWFRPMLGFVQPVPWKFRFNVCESMITLNRGAKVVVGPGQRSFDRKADRMPHVTIMPCFNAEAAGPNLQSAKSVFQAWASRYVITTSRNCWLWRRLGWSGREPFASGWRTTESR
jgi:hypothetical protein